MLTNVDGRDNKEVCADRKQYYGRWYLSPIKRVSSCLGGSGRVRIGLGRVASEIDGGTGEIGWTEYLRGPLSLSRALLGAVPSPPSFSP